MKKLLVIGTKGMAGHIISKYFEELAGYEVYGIARNIVPGNREFNLDVSNVVELKRILEDNAFDIIVNCIGILNKDAENNPEKAIWFNSYFPHLVEKLTKHTNTKFIHISTDCVFSGKRGGYTEDDFKDGIGFYAQSKALGEVTNDKDLTIRTSIIGPELNQNGIGLFHWFMKQPYDAPLKGYSKAFWSGITTLELAKVINESIKQNICGLYEVAGNDKIDKFSLLQIFNEVFRDNKMEIKVDDNYSVDKSLESIRDDFTYEVPSYIEMILQMKEWISKNSSLYPINYSN